jgi:hypothetical protein
MMSSPSRREHDEPGGGDVSASNTRRVAVLSPRAPAAPTPLLTDDDLTELLVALVVADWRRRHPAAREGDR